MAKYKRQTYGKRSSKKKHKIKNPIVLLLLTAVVGLAGGSAADIPIAEEIVSAVYGTVAQYLAPAPKINLASIPAYDGSPYVEINGGVPGFNEEELTTEPFEEYADLDYLGRCGTAYANICFDLMPTEERQSISEVKPTGWKNKPYDFVDQQYLYNRCHLIGFQLAGENANEKNLITGTRYMNVQGMLPFENEVADYVYATGNHVLYRVTPIFEGRNLVASGVEMEAISVEDHGRGVGFHVYVYNVQPGIEIDYATGENREA